MTTVAKAELKSLTALQKELHIPEHDEEEMASNFYNEFIRSTWYTNALVKFKASYSDNQVDFTCPEPCGFLVYSELRQELPEISVKEEFSEIVRIAWTPSIAFNCINKAKLTMGDVDLMNLNNIAIDKYYQYCREIGFERDLQEAVGDVDILTNFTDYLPAYPTICVQPWLYNDNPKKLPMFNDIGKSVIHSYVLRNKITSLLRMQRLEGDRWVNVKPDLSVLNGIPSDKRLPPPEFWGRITTNFRPELNIYRCEEKINIYYKDYVTITSDNPEVMGKKVPITNMSNRPARAFWWVAQNQEALANNYHSNYTTDPDDRQLGHSPLKAFSLTHGSQLVKYEDMDMEHFRLIEPMKHFKSSPMYKGYGCHSISLYPLKVNDVSLSLGDLNTNFSVTLGNTDVMASRRPIMVESTYKIHFTMLVQRKLTLERDKTSPRSAPRYNVYLDMPEPRMNPDEEVDLEV
jgi:hypothetical protein